MIEYITAKFGKWLALIGAVLMAVLYAFTRGRKEGKEVATKQITNDIQKQTDKLDKKLDHVDNQPVDFNAAVERLRKRSTNSRTWGDMP